MGSIESIQDMKKKKDEGRGIDNICGLSKSVIEGMYGEELGTLRRTGKRRFKF